MRRLWSREPSESESADGESTRDCSWESMRAPDSQSERGVDARQDECVQKRSGQAEVLRVGQVGHKVRCGSLLQVHVEPKSQ